MTEGIKGKMTPKERAAAALTLRIPDYVPTFELQFRLEDEMYGSTFLYQGKLEGKTPKEREKLLYENAELMVRVFTDLEWSIFPVHFLYSQEACQTAKYLREMIGDRYMLTIHGDGTFYIPPGDEMLDFVYALADDPDGMKKKAEQMANEAIERNKKYVEAGFDSFILCSDYCFNSGPFLSPAMFEEFIQPYLYKIIKEARADGAYVIKHTDGNIMPILNQLVECNPHALHSLDPMAGVDIREVKRLVGDRVCLCGNVDCSLMQTGTDEEVTASAEYCLTYAKPGGGYIFCTSNTAFKGMPVERYRMIQDIWKRMRAYENKP